tara:strand:+ start:2675 stop:2863 length:189 start_codon:yes stop_codon:yes gene_type:complete
MTANQLIRQRDELLDLTKEIISYLESKGSLFNDQDMLEDAEAYTERMNDLIGLDSKADSSYS